VKDLASDALQGRGPGTTGETRTINYLVTRLKALKLDRDTVVVFTSDNGPWFEGSSGPLRDRKGQAGYDGGYRVPFIVWGPGRVAAGSVPGVPATARRAGVAQASNVAAMPPATLIHVAGREPFWFENICRIVHLHIEWARSGLIRMTNGPVGNRHRS